jgi:hypothetical protein
MMARGYAARMSLQGKLARYFRELAREESGDRAENLLAWGKFVEVLPDENPHIEAIARLQSRFGSPSQFIPRCDGGLHVRLLADRIPSAEQLEHIASLEGEPEPWVYGDWAREGPRPERDGVPQWTVEAEFLTHGFPLSGRWPPRPEHEQLEPVYRYGISEWDRGAHLTVMLEIWADTEAEVSRLARSLLDDFLAQHASEDIEARRLETFRTPGQIEVKPRSARDLEDRVGCVRWQRADVDGRDLRIIWRSQGNPLERVDVAETPDAITIAVYERHGPLFTEEGYPIATAGGGRPSCVLLQLDAPLADRALLDGSCGRAPDDLTIWEIDEKRALDEILALTPDQVDCQAWPRT